MTGLEPGSGSHILQGLLPKPLAGFPAGIHQQGWGTGGEACGSPEAGGSAADSGDGRLAPRAAAPLAPPLVTPTDTASAGSPGDSPSSPQQQTLRQQPQLQPQQRQSRATTRSNKRKAAGADAPLPSALADGDRGSHGGSAVLMPAGSQHPAAWLDTQVQAQPPRRSVYADVFGDAPLLVGGGTGLGHPLAMDLPDLDDLEDVPGLDDLLLGISAEDDGLLGDPFGTRLPPLASPFQSADPLQGAPQLQAHLPVSLAPQQHAGLSAIAAAQHQGPLMQRMQRPSVLLPAAPQGSGSLQALASLQPPAPQLQPHLPHGPPMLNPFLRSSQPAAPSPAVANFMVPQPAAASGAAAGQTGMDRSGSADTRRSHTSLNLLPGVAPKAPATRKGGNKKGGGGGGSRRPLAGAAAAAASRAAAARQLAAAAAAAQAAAQIDGGSAGGAAGGEPKGGQPAALSQQGPAAVAAAAAALPSQQQQEQQPGLGSTSVAAAPQQSHPRWLAADPSCLQPVKRAALPSRRRSELDLSAIKLSAAAPLVAAAGRPSSGIGDSLLRCLFADHYPACWQVAC